MRKLWQHSVYVVMLAMWENTYMHSMTLWLVSAVALEQVWTNFITAVSQIRGVSHGALVVDKIRRAQPEKKNLKYKQPRINSPPLPPTGLQTWICFRGGKWMKAELKGNVSCVRRSSTARENAPQQKQWLLPSPNNTHLFSSSCQVAAVLLTSTPRGGMKSWI